jgi:hypothetical protein
MSENTCPICGQGGVRIERNPTFRRNIVICARCGKYIYDQDMKDCYQHEKFRKVAHIFSGYTRRAWIAGQPLDLTLETFNSLLTSPAPVQTVLDRFDALLVLIGRNTPAANSTVKFNLDVDYPLIFARDRDELVALLDRVMQQGFVVDDNADVDNYRLTMHGWERYEKLITRPSSKPDQCFVAMWFDSQMTPAFEKGFFEGAKNAGYKAVRVDGVDTNGKIDDEIIAQIRASGLVVSDFTGNRGGVYFEAGFALGLGIPVIFTCRKDRENELHFDTRQYNHIFWETPHDLAVKLENRIKATAPVRP